MFCCGYELNVGQACIPRELERKVNIYNATEENIIQRKTRKQNIEFCLSVFIFSVYL